MWFKSPKTKSAYQKLPTNTPHETLTKSDSRKYPLRESVELPVEDGRKTLASVLIPVLLPREVPLYLFFWTSGLLVERTVEGNLLSERTGSKSGDLSRPPLARPGPHDLTIG